MNACEEEGGGDGRGEGREKREIHVRRTDRFHGHLHLTGSHMTSHDIYTGGG